MMGNDPTSCDNTIVIAALVYETLEIQLYNITTYMHTFTIIIQQFCDQYFLFMYFEICAHLYSMYYMVKVKDNFTK